MTSPPGSSRENSGSTTNARQLALICATQFMAWAGFGAILPYLPLFLLNQAHAQLWMIGIIASAYYVGTFCFSTPLGRLSDVIGRKPVILSGVCLYALATFLFVTTRDPWWFVLFRFLEGAGAAATGPAGNALVADITDDEHRSRAFGWLVTAQFGGIVAGPLIGVAVMTLAGGGVRGFYAIFLTGSATMIVIAAVLALFLHEPERLRHTEKVKRPRLRRLLTPPIIAFIVVAATSHFAMGAWEVLWSIWLQSNHATEAFIGLTWAAFSVPMLLSFVGGRIADHGNRFLLMFTGYAFSACCWIMYGATHNLTLFLVMNILEGFAVAWSFPAKMAFLVQVSPARWLGTIQGMEQTAMQLAALIGTLTAPVLYAGLNTDGFDVAGVHVPSIHFAGIHGWALSLGGIFALAGLAYAAPILHREWNRISATGEILSAKEAEALALSEPAAMPNDDSLTLR